MDMNNYSGETMNIILEVPADAYHIEFAVKTVDEYEEEHTYSGRMGLSEIRQARQDYIESLERALCVITGSTDGEEE